LTSSKRKLAGLPEPSQAHEARQGDADYIGEDISQLEHCLQAAASASKSGEYEHKVSLILGADEPTIIAALLHDIGQFLPTPTSEDMIHNGQSVGKKSHDAMGEAYLRDLGFPDKVCKLVGAHVVAKK
jgi:putative nucleotidyltransferase with HDIG domain